MKHMRAAATAAAAASVVLLAIGAPASAGQPIIDHWSEHIEHIEQVEHAADNWCPDIPYDVRYVEDSHGNFQGMVRGGKFYGGSTIHVEGAWINDETGKSFSFVRKGQERDHKVVDNGDGTITITALLTGPTQYYDDDGNKLFKDVGRTFATIVIDEAGTPGWPDDDVFVAFLGAESKGQSDTADNDFCEDVLTYTS